MANSFNKDMNIITNFLKDMDIIAALDDQPNDVGGLTAAELKAKFDEGGKAIQEYINSTLIPEVLGVDADELSRKQNEEARQAAELQRVHAENARNTAELERNQAEQRRIAAETERMLAEQQRADETAGIVAQATAQAQQAASQAAAASKDAVVASQSATNAATSQTNAQASASHAAEHAAAAASGAVSAKSWAIGGTDSRADEDHNNAKFGLSRHFTPLAVV